MENKSESMEKLFTERDTTTNYGKITMLCEILKKVNEALATSNGIVVSLQELKPINEKILKTINNLLE